MKTIEDCFFEYILKDPAVSDEHTSAFIRCFDLFSSVSAESFYVLDIPRNQFCYVKHDDLFLCGFSVDDALKQGYDFYAKIIYPDDFILWADILNAVLGYFVNFEEKRDCIDYFSCTIRLQRNYSFLFPCRPLPQMVYHRIKPICKADELRYLVCSTGASTAKKSGNLCMNNKDGLSYEEFNFITRHWKQKTKECLTERERAILMLAGQGKSSGEIASHLFRGHNTIRNQIKALFSKLNVHSMQEAIEFACNHQLIYPKRDIEEM